MIKILLFTRTDYERLLLCLVLNLVYFVTLALTDLPLEKPNLCFCVLSSSWRTWTLRSCRCASVPWTPWWSGRLRSSGSATPPRGSPSWTPWTPRRDDSKTSKPSWGGSGPVETLRCSEDLVDRPLPFHHTHTHTLLTSLLQKSRALETLRGSSCSVSGFFSSLLGRLANDVYTT